MPKFNPNTGVGQFVGSKPRYQLFLTLTFAIPRVGKKAHKLVRQFCNELAREVGCHLYVAMGWEKQKYRVATHYHMLIGIHESGSGELTIEMAEDLWRSHGNIKASKFLDEKKDEAGGYLEKHESWDFNVACPRERRCRRKKGCVYAPGPWSEHNECL